MKKGPEGISEQEPPEPGPEFTKVLPSPDLVLHRLRSGEALSEQERIQYSVLLLTALTIDSITRGRLSDGIREGKLYLQIGFKPDGDVSQMTVVETATGKPVYHEDLALLESTGATTEDIEQYDNPNNPYLQESH